MKDIIKTVLLINSLDDKCTCCNEPIPVERLIALPGIKLCIKCQEELIDESNSMLSTNT